MYRELMKNMVSNFCGGKSMKINKSARIKFSPLVFRRVGNIRIL